MFISKPGQYTHNIYQARTYQAKPAVLTGTQGEREHAIVLYSTGLIKGVLPVNEALRLANEIADAVEVHGTHPANQNN